MSAINDIAIALDQIGRGDVMVTEAAKTLRNALKSPDRYREHVYAALRNLTWRALSTHSDATELAGWFDLIRHISALAGKHQENVLEIRLRVLSDLIGQSARFYKNQPIEEVLKRKHVIDILSIIHQSGNVIRRSELAGSIGLASANLSRVLLILSNTGLVKRSAEGKEAIFKLTEEGIKAARSTKTKNNIQNNSEIIKSMMNSIPVAICAWDKNGKELVRSNAMNEFLPTQKHPINRRMYERNISLIGWSSGNIINRSTSEIMIDSTRWMRCQVVHHPEGGRMSLMYDITSYKNTEEELNRKISLILEENTRLLKENAEMKHALALRYLIAQSTQDWVTKIALHAREQIFKSSDRRSDKSPFARIVSVPTHMPPENTNAVNYDEELFVHRPMQIANRLNVITNITSSLCEFSSNLENNSVEETVILGQIIRDMVSAAPNPEEFNINFDGRQLMQPVRIHRSILHVLTDLFLVLRHPPYSGGGQVRYKISGDLESHFALVSFEPEKEGKIIWENHDRFKKFMDILERSRTIAEGFGGKLDIENGESHGLILRFPAEFEHLA